MSDEDSKRDEPKEADNKETGATDSPRISEDWMAVIIGGSILIICLLATLLVGADAEGEWQSPLKPWLGKPGKWEASPVEAWVKSEKSILDFQAGHALWGTLGVLIASAIAFGVGSAVMGRDVVKFLKGFLFIFVAAMIAYQIAGQAFVKAYNLEYALWALAIGMLISNTIGTPRWVKPAVQTEFYIKTGLVLLGAGVLFSKLLALGLPGVFVAWVVTPVVLISTYWFGQKILRVPSRSLNMVISADMSVCGVSAAVATSAACKAKKEELSLAIGISLSFTVIMMVIMPMVIKATGMSTILGGAWMGGTIDATGAVAAAGTFLGEEGETVAVTIKMIQNILIGVVAFGVAVYWTTRVEKSKDEPSVGVTEIWRRFPKFILGFVAASIGFSILYAMSDQGPDIVDAVVKGSTKPLRGWFFCLAFVSIGLDTNFRALAKHLGAGQPVVLYVVGQTLNLCLTLLMAYLMFEVVFPGAADVLSK